MSPDNSTFPQQDEPVKQHDTVDNAEGKERYLRDAGKIEDYPETAGPVKMSAPDKDQTAKLTETTGEEKKGDYVNTDDRSKD